MRPDSPLGDITVIFDNPGSSNTRMIINKFELTTLPPYCYSAGSIPAVIDYVESHQNAMGIIGVNWISDVDDSITHAFLDRVKVIGITPDFDSGSNEYYQPHPAYIADKTYPFVRDVYAISRETFDGLGGGFISFVSGDVGQRILLKMGMLPATVPIRLIQITNDY
jgi:phosphate transport system substrate-binding protein